MFIILQKLQPAREIVKINTDSYLHIHAHRNAFFIVLLEIYFLQLFILLIDRFGPLCQLYLTCLCIMPSALIYFLDKKNDTKMVLA